MTSPKRDALVLIHALPKTATWEEILCELYTKEARDEGLLLPDNLNIRYEIVKFDLQENEDELY